MRDIRVASVQFTHEPGDKEYNLGRISHFVREAARQHVDVIAFPEMCITGYWHVRRLHQSQVRELAELVPGGKSCQSLLALSRETGVVIGAGLIELGDGGLLHNTYVVAMPDSRYARHRKIQSFEHECISPGNEYTVFDIPQGCRLGILTCYDNNIIENVRITALLGAEVLLAPHQTGGCASRSPRAMGLIDPRLWHERSKNPGATEAIEAEFRGPKGRGWLMRWLPARAHDNGMFIVFSNGVGFDDGEVRTGNAMIIDCYGQVIAETWKAEDAMVVADLDANLFPTCTGQRWLQARRPELYKPLIERTGKERPTRAVRFGEN